MTFKHGQARRKQRTPEYCAWFSMKQRCLNPNCKDYKNYGGRGISVCDHWLYSFENFFADMGKRPKGLTLERINNNGNYRPGNCCYATPKEQQNNRRKYLKHKYQYWFYGHGPKGEMIIENNQHYVARVFGLHQQHISKCLNARRKTHKGWTFQRIPK